MCFIERETHNFIPKFTEIFPWRETVLWAHGTKSNEKPFFCQLYRVFCFVFSLEKMVHVAIDRYFSLFLKGFEDFPRPEAITDSPSKAFVHLLVFSQGWQFCDFYLLLTLTKEDVFLEWLPFITERVSPASWFTHYKTRYDENKLQDCTTQQRKLEMLSFTGLGCERSQT